MTSPNILRAKTYVLLCLMVCFGSLGDTLLSKGMKQVGELNAATPAVLAQFFQRALSTPAVWLGISSLLLFFLSYMVVLTWADFSYVLPASAAGYAVVPLLGHLLLGETVSSVRWAGVAMICVGVFLVGNTPPCTTAPARLGPQTQPAEGD